MKPPTRASTSGRTATTTKAAKAAPKAASKKAASKKAPHNVPATRARVATSTSPSTNRGLLGGAGFPVRRATIATANHSSEATYEIDIEHKERCELLVRQVKVKNAVMGRFSIAPPTAKASSLFFLVQFGRAAANGRWLKLDYELPSKTKQVASVLLPWVATDLLERTSVELTLILARHRLVREDYEFVVRVTCDGRRMAVPCVSFADPKEDAAVFVAREGPLRGMILLARRDGSAMRVTHLHSSEATSS